MRKILLLMLLCLLPFGVAWGKSEKKIMEETWKEFRQIHPYGLQTVALKHVDDLRVFVISEPSPYVTEDDLRSLFIRHGGKMEVKKQKLGHDGWLKDAVGCVEHDVDSAAFTHDLFMLLYGTDYKAEYTDLDNPSRHVYFSPYRLNYSHELLQSYDFSKESFYVSKDDTILITSINGFSYKTVGDTISTRELRDGIYYSCNPGFVAWAMSANDLNDLTRFKVNARQFALDTDLIFCAINNQNSIVIIGRQRVVPTFILPPLRVETILQMFINKPKSLFQYFGKGDSSEDQGFIAPIGLSEALRNTEYSNLLILTDQMLKSWSENNRVHDLDYDIPAPIDFPFTHGAAAELGHDSIGYYWNSNTVSNYSEKYFISQTGSLPVKFDGGGQNEADTIASIFFASLNQPDLVRVAQYNALNQFYHCIVPFPGFIVSQTKAPAPVWIKTPTMTRSSANWGEGGMQARVLGKALSTLKRIPSVTIRPPVIRPPVIGSSVIGSSMIKPHVISSSLIKPHVLGSSWIRPPVLHSYLRPTWSRLINLSKHDYNALVRHFTTPSKITSTLDFLRPKLTGEFHQFKADLLELSKSIPKEAFTDRNLFLQLFNEHYTSLPPEYINNASLVLDHSIIIQKLKTQSSLIIKQYHQLRSFASGIYERKLSLRLTELNFESSEGVGMMFKKKRLHTASDLRTIMENAASLEIANVSFSECTAREHIVKIDKVNTGIIERDATEAININDYCVNEPVQLENSTVTVTLDKQEDKLTQGVKSEQLEITIQNQSKSTLSILVDHVKKAVQRLFKNSDKVNNKFQLKYQLLKDLKQPGIDFDIQDIKLEESTHFGNIEMQHDNETILEMAA